MALELGDCLPELLSNKALVCPRPHELAVRKQCVRENLAQPERQLLFCGSDPQGARFGKQHAFSDQVLDDAPRIHRQHLGRYVVRTELPQLRLHVAGCDGLATDLREDLGRRVGGPEHVRHQGDDHGGRYKKEDAAHDPAQGFPSVTEQLQHR